MRKKGRNPWVIVGLLGGLAYPLAVYFGLNRVPHSVLIGVALALIGIRLFSLRKILSKQTRYLAFTALVFGLIAIAVLNSDFAVKSYPIMVSLGVATIFALSLKFPPSAVERMARLHEPDMPEAGVLYTRKVTIVWVVFLLCNAAISTVTALVGTLEQWTLWNGLISYLLMGVLFAGEYCVRKMVRR